MGDGAGERGEGGLGGLAENAEERHFMHASVGGKEQVARFHRACIEDRRKKRQIVGGTGGHKVAGAIGAEEGQKRVTLYKAAEKKTT